MTAPWLLASDDADLAREAIAAAAAVGVALDPSPNRSGAVAAAIEGAGAGRRVVLAVIEEPAPADLVALARAAGTDRRALVAVVGAPRRSAAVAIALDLGIPTVRELGPLSAMLALETKGIARPWAASQRSLSAVDRLRLGMTREGSEAAQGHWVPVDGRQVGWASTPRSRPTSVGSPRDAGEAASTLQRVASAGPPARPALPGVRPEAAVEVLFGPPRALSDPASKAALAPYGIPVPTEELCASPSRAAAEATRIGFPVSIALASPDLRVWDHPDLAVDGVDNGARVREVYRQVVALAEERAPTARILGVTVTATTPCRAFLRAVLTPLADNLVRVELGFADPHGLACDDRTWTVWPAVDGRFEQVLLRLDGAQLVLGLATHERKATVAALENVVGRLAAFVDDRRAEVDSVVVDPLALLLGGGVEVREACVTVNDAFVRSLDVGRR